MALDMPNNPSDGDTFIASNGTNYVYELATDRWKVQADSAAGRNLWARNDLETEIYPIYDGDSVILKNLAASEVIDVDPTVGITLVSGLKFVGDVDIDGLTDLP